MTGHARTAASTSLYGILEENGLRCPYHGWLYDEMGQCLEQPDEGSESTFKERVKLTSYPVEQVGGGVLFAYVAMGGERA